MFIGLQARTLATSASAASSRFACKSGGFGDGHGFKAVAPAFRPDV
jgi:hypothetical protein